MLNSAVMRDSLVDPGFLREEHCSTRWMQSLAVPVGVNLRELSPEKQDLRRVIHPREHDQQGSGSPIGRSESAAAKVKTDGNLADGKEHRRCCSADPDVAPMDMNVRQYLVNHRKEQSRDYEREPEVRQRPKCARYWEQCLEVLADCGQ